MGIKNGVLSVSNMLWMKFPAYVSSVWAVAFFCSMQHTVDMSFSSSTQFSKMST